MSGTGSGGVTARDQGAALMKLGKFADAAAALRRAVEENPGDEASWRFLGGALASSGDASGAVRAFERAVALVPQSAKNHYNLAVAFQSAGQLYEAKTHLEQAIALDPGYDQAKATLDALSAQGETRGYGVPQATADAAPMPPAAPPRPHGAPSASDDLAPVGGSFGVPPASAGGTAIGGRSQDADDLAAVGGGGSAYGAPPAAPPSSEGVGVPNLRSSPPGMPGSYAPPPVLGMGYGQTLNTSGQHGVVPAEINGGWNWGAFYFTWIWLFNHKMAALAIGLIVFSVLSFFVPFIGILGLGISIWLGVSGNKLGWQNRRFDSVEDFKNCQGVWAKWTLGVFLVSILLIPILAAILFPVFAAARRAAGGG